jgi:hypothetical protein
MNSGRVQLGSSVKKRKMPKSSQVVPFSPVSPTKPHVGAEDALGHDVYEVTRGTGTVVEKDGIDFTNFQASTSSDWGDMSPRKKIPRASFAKMKNQVKSLWSATATYFFRHILEGTLKYYGTQSHFFAFILP